MTEASSTQQDSIYATLRQWITVGRFLPGERLKIRNVAADMGVGHSGGSFGEQPQCRCGGAAAVRARIR